MTEKSLLTLRDIAELLGLRYRSVIDCKEYFSDYLKGLFDGRHYRYWSDNLDFFESVFALRERGYTFAMIRDILAEKQDMAGNQALKDLFSHLDDVGEEEGGRTKRKEEEGGWTRREDEERGGMMRPEDEGGWKTSYEEGGECSECFKQVSEFKSELQELMESQVHSEVSSQILQTLSTLEDALLKLTSEINGALTQVYKGIYQLQSVMQDLENRLGKLEEELGEGKGEQTKLPQLDLEQLQVQKPDLQINTEYIQPDVVEVNGYEHTDIETVRCSIYNGRPDKQTVGRWIKAQREQNSGVSYAELAKRLNEAGIPTLSGRVEWSRSVVRNLAVYNNQN